MVVDDEDANRGGVITSEKPCQPATNHTLAARLLEALDRLSEAALFGMRLECDGVSRSLSQALLYLGIDHEIRSGCLTVEGCGRTPLHWWVVLPDGAHCDIRARMWLGDDPKVPHGVFFPNAEQRYETRSVGALVPCPILFWVVTTQELEPFVQQVCGVAKAPA